MDEKRTNLNEDDIALIKQTFVGNEQLLKNIRALFFGLEVSLADKETIRATFSNQELRKIMWKRFLPGLDKDAPIGQIQHEWANAETMVFDKAPSTIAQALKYKEGAIEMVRSALDLLDNPDGPKLSLQYSANMDDEIGSKLLTNNQFIKHVDYQLLMMWLIATQEEKKTPAEIAKVMHKDSSQ